MTERERDRDLAGVMVGRRDRHPHFFRWKAAGFGGSSQDVHFLADFIFWGCSAPSQYLLSAPLFLSLSQLLPPPPLNISSLSLSTFHISLPLSVAFFVDSLFFYLYILLHLSRSLSPPFIPINFSINVQFKINI